MTSPFKIPLSVHMRIIETRILLAPWEGVGERLEEAVNERIRILKEIRKKYPDIK